MIEKVLGIKHRFDYLSEKLAAPDAMNDRDLWREMVKERASLEEIVVAYDEYMTAQASLENCRTMLNDHLDVEMKELVRAEIDELETKQDIAQLLDSAREGAATRIFIGSENKLFSLSGSSVIAAPYRGSDGRVVGVVGVIGPTRLNYARIVPMVDFTAQSLSRLIR